MKTPLADMPLIDCELKAMCEQGSHVEDNEFAAAHSQAAGILGGAISRGAPRQPPLILVKMTAVNVAFDREDFGRQRALCVHLVLDREIQDPGANPQEPRLKDVHRVQLTLNDAFAGKFHAGQDFYLEIRPA